MACSSTGCPVSTKHAVVVWYLAGVCLFTVLGNSESNFTEIMKLKEQAQFSAESCFS